MQENNRVIPQAVNKRKRVDSSLKSSSRPMRVIAKTNKTVLAAEPAVHRLQMRKQIVNVMKCHSCWVSSHKN